MNKSDINKIVKIRQFIIESYNNLDGLKNAGANTAVIKQTEVARDYEHIISEIDSILRPHVSFE
tara:strand:+ start:154 stop:345 length:192 start_codon:yes stop_codon:yes gene_type:complete